MGILPTILCYPYSKRKIEENYNMLNTSIIASKQEFDEGEVLYQLLVMLLDIQDECWEKSE